MFNEFEKKYFFECKEDLFIKFLCRKGYNIFYFCFCLKNLLYINYEFFNVCFVLEFIFYFLKLFLYCIN